MSVRTWVLALLALAACSTNPEESPTQAVAPEELVVTAVDFGFELDRETIRAGEVQTVLINEGRKDHQAGFYRLNDGVEYEEFVETILKDDSQIPQLAEGKGGPLRPVNPGDSYTRPSDELEPGTYALLCSIRDGETGKNHYDLGMIARLEVK